MYCSFQRCGKGVVKYIIVSSNKLDKGNVKYVREPIYKGSDKLLNGRNFYNSFTRKPGADFAIRNLHGSTGPV